MWYIQQIQPVQTFPPQGWLVVMMKNRCGGWKLKNINSSLSCLFSKLKDISNIIKYHQMYKSSYLNC